MINNVMLVGRLFKELKRNKIVLAVNRSYKNSEGVYETDFIPVIMWKDMLGNIKEYTKKGDIIGIKGRLETKSNKVVIIAEKITFMSTKGDK